MTDDLRLLLSMDDVARRFGCALNPRLRTALEQDLRWPSRVAGSAPRLDGTTLPDNVVRFGPNVETSAARKAIR